MALPSSGRISSTDILTELGYTSNDRILSTVRTDSGRRQVNVNGSWINLNICSPSIPKSDPPHKAEDWYNYDHSIGSITSATISGNSTIFSGSTHTYTCSYTTDGGTGITFNWNAGDKGTIVSGQGTNSVQIQFNFTNPYENQTSNVICVVSNDCGDRVSNTLTINPFIYYNSLISTNYYKNNCGDCYSPNPYFVTVPYGTFRTYTFDGQSIVDTQAQIDAQNQANVYGTCYYNGVNISLNSPSYSGSMSSDNGIRPTDYIEIGASGGSGLIEFSFDNSSWFDANIGSTNLGFSRETNGGSTQVYARQKGACSNVASRTVNHRLTYGNTGLSGSMPKNDCPSGTTGTNGSYNVSANQYWRDNSTDANNRAWVEAQAQANANGGCTSICYPSHPASVSISPSNLFIEQGTNMSLFMPIINPENFEYVSYRIMKDGVYQTGTLTHPFTNPSYNVNSTGRWKFTSILVHSCGDQAVGTGSDPDEVRVLNTELQTGDINLGSSVAWNPTTRNCYIYGDYSPYTPSYLWEIDSTNVPDIYIYDQNTNQVKVNKNFTGSGGIGFIRLKCTVSIASTITMIRYHVFVVNYSD